MMNAFLQVIGVAFFLTLCIVILCVIAAAIQAIFNPKAREDWKDIFSFSKDFFHDLAKIILNKMIKIMIAWRNRYVR